jgi:hypothetical protein
MVLAEDATLIAQADGIAATAGKLQRHLEDRLAAYPTQAEHVRGLLASLGSVATLAADARKTGDAGDPARLLRVADELAQHAQFLRRQAPETLFRLRLVEIGLPLALSLVSILFVLRYPLTERRCREIRELLTRRRGQPMRLLT